MNWNEMKFRAFIFLLFRKLFELNVRKWHWLNIKNIIIDFVIYTMMLMNCRRLLLLLFLEENTTQSNLNRRNKFNKLNTFYYFITLCFILFFCWNLKTNIFLLLFLLFDCDITIVSVFSEKALNSFVVSFLLLKFFCFVLNEKQQQQ